MLAKNIIKSITKTLVVSSLVCGIAFSSQSKFNAYTDSSITLNDSEKPMLSELESDSKEGGNRLQYGETKIESGPAFCPTLSFNKFYDKAYINTVNLLVQNSDAENIMKLIKFYNSDSDPETIKSDNEEVQKILNSYPDVVNNINTFSECYDSKNRTIKDPSGEATYYYTTQRKSLIYSALTKLILTAYSEPLKHFEEQMEIFYNYLTTRHRREHIPPSFEKGSSTSTNSATHTEFMMVYYIIKNDTDILEKFNNFTNMFTSGATVTSEEREAAFHELINNLWPKLPDRIYSAHCMCRVCEAFLTSLYNVCECPGVFISINPKYESPSGPYGTLKKLRLGEDSHHHHSSGHHGHSRSYHYSSSPSSSSRSRSRSNHNHHGHKRRDNNGHRKSHHHHHKH